MFWKCHVNFDSMTTSTWTSGFKKEHFSYNTDFTLAHIQIISSTWILLEMLPLTHLKQKQEEYPLKYYTSHKKQLVLLSQKSPAIVSPAQRYQGKHCLWKLWLGPWKWRDLLWKKDQCLIFFFFLIDHLAFSC